MKRIIGLFTGFAMIIAMMGMPVRAEESTRVVDDYDCDVIEEAHTFAAELMAGKALDVGGVFIEDRGENQYLVTYQVDADNWYLKEVHFEAINDGDADYIFSKGGLIPGKFTVRKEFELEDEMTQFSFLYKSGSEVLSFAAHAVVCQPAVYETIEYEQTVVSDVETSYSLDGVSNYFPAELSWVHHLWPSIEGASWIWESEYVDSPRTGEKLYFKRNFTVIGEPVNAWLKITTDNEYNATINDQPDPAYSDDDWKTVEHYDVLSQVQTGLNTLLIEAINWPYSTDSPTTNPGAVIFKLFIVSSEERMVTPEVCESAWGFGTDADGSNWSQIIEIE